MKGDEDTQWEQCKKKLAEIISLKCRGFGITNEVNYSPSQFYYKHSNNIYILFSKKPCIAREEELQSVAITEKNVDSLHTWGIER